MKNEITTWRKSGVTSGNYSENVSLRFLIVTLFAPSRLTRVTRFYEGKRTMKNAQTHAIRDHAKCPRRDTARTRNIGDRVLKYRERLLNYYVSRTAERANGAEERFALAPATFCLLLFLLLSPRDSRPLAVSLKLTHERRPLTCVRLPLCVIEWWCWWWFTTKDAEDSPDSQPSSSPVVSHSLLSASLDSLGVSCPPIPNCTPSPLLFVVAGTAGDVLPPTLCINRLTCN